MLIQLTLDCSLKCKHCMNSCSPVDIGRRMSMATVNKVIDFCKENYIGGQVFVISGGEPTLHPNWNTIIEMFLKEFPNSVITISSNGDFLNYDEKVEIMKNLLSTYSIRLNLQITSLEKWYDNYEFVHSKLDVIKTLPNTILVDDYKLHIMDIGRARNLDDEEIHPKDHPSCFKSYMVAKQVNNTQEWLTTLTMYGQFCHPLITWDGFVSHSESDKCSIIGRVDHFRFETAKRFKPCKNCRNYERFENRVKLGMRKEVQINEIINR